MDSSYYQNQVNRLEKEIADLLEKIADENKKVTDKRKQINSVNSSINKRTSISGRNYRKLQIEVYKKDIFNCKTKIAKHKKNIASKSSELVRMKQELVKTRQSEKKKQQDKQLKSQKQLQNNIEIQKAQLKTLSTQNYSAQNKKLSANEDLTESNKQYDFFISYASEDKDDIAGDLAVKLKNSGFKVWYDEFELKIGDSLRKKIDYGLSNAKYGIVIISHSFFEKNWTEYELNGLLAREMNGHEVIILPIWHKITKDEVLKYSPPLADKFALDTSRHTIEYIVEHLKNL